MIFRKLFPILLVSLAFSLHVNAQKPPVKWGKVLPVDLNMKTYPLDPDAPAVVLCDFGQVEVTNRSFYERHIRIKILNEKGLKYAHIEIPYQSKNEYERLQELKAHTINQTADGKLVVSRVPARSIKRVKIDSKNSKAVFDFPDVKPGSIIEYKYTLVSLDFIRLRPWHFQHEIPVVWSEYRTSVPEYFTYLVTYDSGESLTKDQQDTYVGKLTWMLSTRENKAFATLAKEEYVLYEVPGVFKVSVMRGRYKRSVMRGLPAYKSNEDIYTDRNNSPQLRFHLFESSGYFPFFFKRLLLTTEDDIETPSSTGALWYAPNSGYVQYRLESWQDMNERLLKNPRFNVDLMKSANFKPLFDELFTTDATPEKKMLALYNYVNQKIKWNGEYSEYASDGVAKILKKGEGNSAENNLLLLQLLRKAGISASPVLIKTRDQGKVETIYPVWHQFNHVIVLAEVDGNKYVLDATRPELAPGQLAGIVVNQPGWSVSATEPGFVTIDAHGSIERENVIVAAR